MKLDSDTIDELCDEIEVQWECHLMSRAVFNSSYFPNQRVYKTPNFYSKHGLEFKIEILNTDSITFKRASERIRVWLNQNYIIRLFGILDSKKLIEYGIKNDVKVIKLVKLLRNNIGAHSTGKRVSNYNYLKNATLLINDLFERNINIEEVKSYTLSIDTVLFPMKEKCIDFIKELH